MGRCSGPCGVRDHGCRVLGAPPVIGTFGRLPEWGIEATTPAAEGLGARRAGTPRSRNEVGTVPQRLRNAPVASMDDMIQLSRRQLAVLLVPVVALLIVAGRQLGDRGGGAPAARPVAVERSAAGPEPERIVLVVHVAGAVEEPGLYYPSPRGRASRMRSRRRAASSPVPTSLPSTWPRPLPTASTSSSRVARHPVQRRAIRRPPPPAPRCSSRAPPSSSSTSCPGSGP